MERSCRSSIFLTAAVRFRAERMKRYWPSSPIFLACWAFLMKSSANFSCWRIDFSMERSPARTFISRSIRRSSLLLNKPMNLSLLLQRPDQAKHKPANAHPAMARVIDSVLQANSQTRSQAAQCDREEYLPPAADGERDGANQLQDAVDSFLHIVAGAGPPTWGRRCFRIWRFGHPRLSIH